MNHQDVVLPLEKKLRKDIYNSINGEQLQQILSDVRIEVDDQIQLDKAFLENYHYKVHQDATPDLYNLFEGVRKKLEFDENVDYFIKNDQSANASATSSSGKEVPHSILLNSRLLEMMNEQELRFIIGHEMGHLVNESHKVARLIAFLYPGQQNPPLVLSHKLNYWHKLTEISSDRFGLVACDNDLYAFLSAHLKLISGLNTQTTNIDLDAFLQDNIDKAEAWKKNPILHQQSHPNAPLRISALHLFSGSSFFTDNPSTEDNSLEAVNDKVNELSEALQMSAQTEKDIHLQFFIASAGILTANLDEQMNKDEYEKIIHTLATYMSFPKGFLKYIHDNFTPKEVFKKSVHEALQIDPGLKHDMFIYLTELAISDQSIERAEMDFLYDVGEDFGFSKEDISHKIAYVLRQKFVPDVYG